MLTLEKIIELDEKVNNTVQVIEDLRTENRQLKELQTENDLLRKNLKEYEAKVVALEKQIALFKGDQDEIESGIQNVVQTLDRLLKKTAQDEKIQSTPSPSAEKSGKEKAQKNNTEAKSRSLTSPESKELASETEPQREDPAQACAVEDRHQIFKEEVPPKASFSDVEIDETIENLDIF